MSTYRRSSLVAALVAGGFIGATPEAEALSCGGDPFSERLTLIDVILVEGDAEPELEARAWGSGADLHPASGYNDPDFAQIAFRDATVYFVQEPTQ